MKYLLFALLPAAALALTCVNKQTGITGGYRSTQQQGGATCEANKWCMKIRSDSGEGDESMFVLTPFGTKVSSAEVIGINSKCAEDASEEETCDTNAAGKCWKVESEGSKVQLQCLYFFEQTFPVVGDLLLRFGQLQRSRLRAGR